MLTYTCSNEPGSSHIYIHVFPDNGKCNNSNSSNPKYLTFNGIGIWLDRTKELVSVISDAFAPIFWVCHCWSEGFVCIILFQQEGGKLRERGTRVGKKSRQCKLTISRISFCSTKLRNWKWRERKDVCKNLRLFCWISKTGIRFFWIRNQSSSNLTKETPVKMSMSQLRCYLRPFLVPFELFLQTLCLDPLISSDHSSMDIFAFWSSCSQRLNKSFEIGSIIELGANFVLHHRREQSKKLQKCLH